MLTLDAEVLLMGWERAGRAARAGDLADGPDPPFRRLVSLPKGLPNEPGPASAHPPAATRIRVCPSTTDPLTLIRPARGPRRAALVWRQRPGPIGAR